MLENKKATSLIIDGVLWKKLKIRAIQEDTSVSKIIDKLIREHMGE